MSEHMLEERIASLEAAVQRCERCTGGMLSSNGFRELVVHEEKKVQALLDKYRDRDWDSVGNRIIITPFDELNLTPFSYDLSIGKEVMCLRSPERTIMQTPWNVEPGQTVAVISREFIALPPTYAATVWPRYKLVQEGLFQSMVKIDPT